MTNKLIQLISIGFFLAALCLNESHSLAANESDSKVLNVIREITESLTIKVPPETRRPIPGVAFVHQSARRFNQLISSPGQENALRSVSGDYPSTRGLAYSYSRSLLGMLPVPSIGSHPKQTMDSASGDSLLENNVNLSLYFSMMPKDRAAFYVLQLQAEIEYNQRLFYLVDKHSVALYLALENPGENVEWALRAQQILPRHASFLQDLENKIEKLKNEKTHFEAFLKSSEGTSKMPFVSDRDWSEEKLLKVDVTFKPGTSKEKTHEWVSAFGRIMSSDFHAIPLGAQQVLGFGNLGVVFEHFSPSFETRIASGIYPAVRVAHVSALSFFQNLFVSTPSTIETFGLVRRGDWPGPANQNPKPAASVSRCWNLKI